MPFIFVIPFLLIDNTSLIFALILITLLITFIARLSLVKIFSRIKNILPFMFLITIFIPLYVGEHIAFEINLGFKILVYKEGLNFAFLLFLRMLGAVFIYMSLFSTLTYSEFIEALTKLRLPSFFVGSFVIMLHYIPIIAGSDTRILDAQELRGKKVTTYWQKLKAHAYLMGKNIALNLERSEILYDSLKMRGFSGKF